MEPNFYRTPYGYYPPSRFMPSPYKTRNYYSNRINNTSANYNKKREEEFFSKKVSVEDKEKRSSENQKPIFEIFGIKLFFDDLLLISLIFFLYSEGVQDQSLFIALILLLLS